MSAGKTSPGPFPSTVPGSNPPGAGGAPTAPPPYGSPAPAPNPTGSGGGTAPNPALSGLSIEADNLILAAQRRLGETEAEMKQRIAQELGDVLDRAVDKIEKTAPDPALAEKQYEDFKTKLAHAVGKAKTDANLFLNGLLSDTNLEARLDELLDAKVTPRVHAAIERELSGRSFEAPPRGSRTARESRWEQYKRENPTMVRNVVMLLALLGLIIAAVYVYNRGDTSSATNVLTSPSATGTNATAPPTAVATVAVTVSTSTAAPVVASASASAQSGGNASPAPATSGSAAPIVPSSDTPSPANDNTAPAEEKVLVTQVLIDELHKFRGDLAVGRTADQNKVETWLADARYGAANDNAADSLIDCGCGKARKVVVNGQDRLDISRCHLGGKWPKQVASARLPAPRPPPPR